MVVRTKKQTEEIIQPELNIGLVGHVDHGKTTLTQSLSGRWTDTHSEELKRGITIRLGYADCSFYKCEDHGYGTKEKCEICKKNCKLVRKISLVDAPGHETLMATMLSGAAIMDAALLVIAANEECPQPQTREHLVALNIVGIKNIIIIQNKIDLVTEEEALKNYEQIKNFVKGTIAENTPIIPISAQHNVNIDILIKHIVEDFKVPEYDTIKEPLFFVARSFDINKPGTQVKDLKGGVLGGALKQGILKIGDNIEIKPGRKLEKQGKVFWESINTEIVGLRTGENSVEEVHPGGSIGILTKLDPALVKSDSLTGNLVGLPGKLPQIWQELKLEPKLLERVVGAKDNLVVEPIKKGEYLMLNVNSASTVGIVRELRKNMIDVVLRIPVCANLNDRITISRNIGSRWRLIGYSFIK